jgi:Ca-activated chloride channel family protein
MLLFGQAHRIFEVPSKGGRRRANGAAPRTTMTKRYPLLTLLILAPFFGAAVPIAAQKDNIVIRRTVDLVQLNVAVTDKKGNYITRLRPSDFAIFEDGIRQEAATFEEANEAPQILDPAPGGGQPKLVASGSTGELRDSGSQGFLPSDSSGQLSSPMTGASVFILFDTSNYMYRGFVFAQDAIADFVRSMDHPDRVALYSYSRDFSRVSLITPDRSVVLHGVRTTVAGDDAALYDALLMTLRDAARLTGRKVVVVFSNGPDNASMVAPEDVRELAQSEGIPIYMISTQEARLEPVSSAVFERMSASTGGKAYFAKNWRAQQQAFASIRDDLAHLYSLSYYPQPNPNRGWRSITVKLIGDGMKGYRIRTRSGYRPKEIRLTEQTVPGP